MPPPTFGFPARLDRSQGFFHGLRLWVSRLRRYLLLLLLLEAFGYFLGKGLVNVAAGRRALQAASDDRIETNRCRWLAVFYGANIKRAFERTVRAFDLSSDFESAGCRACIPVIGAQVKRAAFCTVGGAMAEDCLSEIADVNVFWPRLRHGDRTWGLILGKVDLNADKVATLAGLASIQSDPASGTGFAIYDVAGIYFTFEACGFKPSCRGVFALFHVQSGLPSNGGPPRERLIISGTA